MTRYELLDRIGVGRVAEIFRGKAVAFGGFEKPVAIKRILPHLSQDPRFVELLIAEAKVMSLLRHRNIVQIFDVGLGDDGTYFLVMEYVDGKDVGAVQRGLEARRRRLPFDLALHVGAEICEALEHAHSARAPDGKPMSLVHRDVSPSNVLLSRAGEVKLTDFGLAKRADQEVTGHGAVRGKLAYVSPEQARSAQVEPRSDVFSVGILLWELVTGRRLFSGLGAMEALGAVREAKLPRPRDVDARLPPEIDALIASALAPEPRRRPTAGQLGAELRSLRYSLEVAAGDPATELAKIIDTAEEVERSSAQPIAPAPVELDGSEVTVIQIRTADVFSMHADDGDSVARARAVIERFEEEETRQARLSRDQMASLCASAPRDPGERAPAAPPPLPGVRRRATTDEPTVAHASLGTAVAALPPGPVAPSQSFEGDEATRLLAPAGLRTLVPEHARPPRPPTRPPPVPDSPPGARMRPPTPGPPALPPPRGPVHDRRGRGAPPPVGWTAASRPKPPAMTVAPLAPPLVLQPLPVMQPPPVMQLPVAPPQVVQPSPMMPLAPPVMQPPVMLPPVMPIAQPPGGYASWGPPAQLPIGAPLAAQPMYERQPPRRSAGAQPRRSDRHRQTALRPWMLVIGALLAALLAFAVTRACIRTPTKRRNSSEIQERGPGVAAQGPPRTRTGARLPECCG